jgi:hypothetical protein
MSHRISILFVTLVVLAAGESVVRATRTTGSALRVHLDLYMADQAAEVERLVQLAHAVILGGTGPRLI